MSELTTAQTLGKFRRELEAESIDGPVVNELVAFAGRGLLEYGLTLTEDGE